MKRGFIRALWGIHDNSHRLLKRRFRVDKNVQSVLNNKFKHQFKVYILGDNNYRVMVDLGFNCVLVDKRPYLYDLVKHQYRNKLELIKYAFDEDKYTELVYLDWDCFPTKNIPEDIWQNMKSKGVFQANLQQYRNIKAPWRMTDPRKVPNGGFLYLGDSDLPDQAIKFWEECGSPDNDEIGWARLCDELSGGWQDIDYYWQNFESMYSNLWRGSVYNESLLLEKKDLCFIHHQGGNK